jgi:zinc metalloprotease ZmpB
VVSECNAQKSFNYFIWYHVLVFEITLDVYVQRDDAGQVRHLSHLQQPYVAPEGTSQLPKDLAAQYIRDVAPIYELDPDMLTNLNENVGQKMTDEGSMLRFAEEKNIMETYVISYSQTYFGLQIWEAGFSVNMQASPIGVTSSQSTVHSKVKMRKPDENSEFMPERIDTSILTRILGLDSGETRDLEINGTGLLVYQYDPNLRIDVQDVQGNQGEQLLEGKNPTLLLPEVNNPLIRVLTKCLKRYA